MTKWKQSKNNLFKIISSLVVRHRCLFVTSWYVVDLTTWLQEQCTLVRGVCCWPDWWTYKFSAWGLIACNFWGGFYKRGCLLHSYSLTDTRLGDRGMSWFFFCKCWDAWLMRLELLLPLEELLDVACMFRNDNWILVNLNKTGGVSVMNVSSVLVSHCSYNLAMSSWSIVACIRINYCGCFIWPLRLCF